jgi:hypothetical protein
MVKIRNSAGVIAQNRSCEGLVFSCGFDPFLVIRPASFGDFILSFSHGFVIEIFIL